MPTLHVNYMQSSFSVESRVDSQTEFHLLSPEGLLNWFKNQQEFLKLNDSPREKLHINILYIYILFIKILYMHKCFYFLSPSKGVGHKKPPTHARKKITGSSTGLVT